VKVVLQALEGGKGNNLVTLGFTVVNCEAKFACRIMIGNDIYGVEKTRLGDLTS